MNKNTILVIVGALLVGGAVGYIGAGYQYAAQIDKAKALFPTQTTMMSVSGTIQSIAGNTITMQSSSLNPFEKVPAVRKITVTSETKILKTEPKDPRVFQKEMDAFQKAVQKVSTSTEATSLPTPPQPVTETPLKLSDLKVGDMITASAAADIKTQASFNAVTITVVVVGTAVAIPPVITNGAPPPPPIKK